MSVLKVKRLNEKARLPERATAGSAGYDLRACIEQPMVIEPGQVRKIPTGLAIELADEHHVALIFARSSMGVKHGLPGQRGRGDRLGLPRRGLHLSAQLFGRPLHRTATGPGGAALGDAGGAAGGAGGGTAFRHRSRRRGIWFHREVGEKRTSKQRGEMTL